MIELVTITAPNLEPITTAEAKDNSRITYDSDDSEIARMISAARQVVEARTGMRLYTQTVEVRADTFLELTNRSKRSDVIELMCGPIQAIDSLKYYDGDDVDQTFDSSKYWADLTGTPARIQCKSSWPSTNERIGNVRIRMTAGWDDQDNIPAVFKQAICLLVDHFYENRSATTELNLKEIPEGVNNLLFSVPEYHHYATGSL